MKYNPVDSTLKEVMLMRTVVRIAVTFVVAVTALVAAQAAASAATAIEYGLIVAP